jgi:hypothetical protein
LSIGGIPLLILATQETQCVGKSGGISPVKKTHHTGPVCGGRCLQQPGPKA